jgi:hypothetical protein
LINRGKYYYDYSATSRDHLNRAIKHLENFDMNSEVSCLFYAALELRFGIEARLFEYIDATFNSLQMNSSVIKEYVAARLLKRLISADEYADKKATLKITSEETHSSTILEYTPVTKELAKMHGKLGEMLHYKFIRNNPNWILKVEISGKEGKTLMYYRKFLDEVVVELKEATRGSLLSHSKFTKIVENIIEEESDEREMLL